VTGHSYVAYGPLAAGASVVIYEGGPTTPHPGRFWEIIEQRGVTIFYTAPTAIRALMRLGEDIPARYDLTKLRLLGSVGEPINPEAWMWYHEHIGRRRCPIVDTWWQTETGAIMISPVPGATATSQVPARCRCPASMRPSSMPGQRSAGRRRRRVLVITRPWPSMPRTIWGDNERYLRTYWETFQNRYYVAGDSAHRDKDGYFWIMGRIDDVLNVAGHRLGTMEIESALVAHPRVAEAAVVGRQHEIKGESVFAYVVLRGERPAGAETEKFAKTLRDWVTEQLGAIARPDDIRFANNLPKTRSGKIMRRLLRAIARNEDITQDLSTLENPSIIDQLRGVESAAAAPAVKAKAKSKPKKKAKKKAKEKATAKARPSGKKRPANKSAKKPAKKAAKKAVKKLARKPAKKRAPPRRKK
jgi:acetyl-CoA synthetase